MRQLDKLISYSLDKEIDNALKNGQFHVLEVNYHKKYNNRLVMTTQNNADKKIMKVSIDNAGIVKSDSPDTSFDIEKSIMTDISVKKFFSIYGNKIFQLNSVKLESPDRKSSIIIEADGES